MSATRSILCLTAISGVAALRTLALNPQSAHASTRPNAAASDSSPRSARSIALPPPDQIIGLDTSLAIRPLHTFETADDPGTPGPDLNGQESHGSDSPGQAADTDASHLLFDPPPFALPAFEPTRFSMKTPPLAPELLDGASIDITPLDQPSAAHSVLFRFNRNTNLSDGGLSNANARLPSENDAFADTSSGERFNRYSMNIEWVPTGARNQFQWLVVGGVQAIKADIGRLNDASIGLTQARGTVAMPIVGTGFRWAPADTFSISTLARTQTLEGDASMTNLILSADLMLSRTVGLSAGYEYFESDLTVESVQTQIDREGVFARLTIRF